MAGYLIHLIASSSKIQSKLDFIVRKIIFMLLM